MATEQSSSKAENTRFGTKYRAEVVAKMKERFGYANAHQIPRIEKVVVSMGVGRQAVQNSKAIEGALADLTRITGQKPAIRRARKSIANFKLREGMAIGAIVTLRRERMFEFLDRFVSIALPRVRDFKGISRKGFDGRGNYSIGIQEHSIFPEIDVEKSGQAGLNITVVTTAKNDDEGRALLEEIGFPFRQ
jgi:large subunit ribosomal protein L5